MYKNYPNGKKRFGIVARMMMNVNGERQYSTPYIPETLNWSSSEFTKMMSGITTTLQNFTRSFAGMHDFARRFLYSAVFNARSQKKLQQGIWSKICPETPFRARMCLEGLQNSLTFSLFPKKTPFRAQLRARNGWIFSRKRFVWLSLACEFASLTSGAQRLSNRKLIFRR